MTNKTRIAILQRIENAVSEGFYLRPMQMARLGSSFTSDYYGGVCVLGALDGNGSNVVNYGFNDSLDLSWQELQALEAGFEGWTNGKDTTNEFYQLGAFIAREYANVGEND